MKKVLHVEFDDDELPGLKRTLDRALNTWEPKEVPQFIWQLEAKIVARLNDIKREQESGPSKD